MQSAIDWSVTSTTVPVVCVVLLICLCGALAAIESALLNLNRYRLRNLVRLGNRNARRLEQLLAQPDLLAAAFLLCRLVLILSAAVLAGASVPHVSPGLPPGWAMALCIAALTIVCAVLAEIAPRAVGARFPERIALPTAPVPYAIYIALRPLAWLVQALASTGLRTLGINLLPSAAFHTDARDEARGLVAEPSHQRMLARLLELQSATVQDIMIPRSEISSIDLSDDWDSILDLLRTTPHTRLPLCEGTFDNVVGMVHMKKVAHALAHGALTREILMELAREREAYFVPEGTTLDVQLQNFQRDRRRIALVVDEYGDIRGLVTLEDILEEIVGEFTSDPGTLHRDVHRDSDGSFVVNGAINVRVLNRTLGWSLPAKGPRTLNGVILESLEDIPTAGTSLRIGDLSIEILQAVDNAVKTARIRRIDAEAAEANGA